MSCPRICAAAAIALLLVPGGTFGEEISPLLSARSEDTSSFRSHQLQNEPNIDYIRSRNAEIAAVVVGLSELVYTRQMLPATPGKLQEQVADILAQLQRQAPGAAWVKLHLYGATASDAPRIREAVRQYFSGKTTPAMSCVITALPLRSEVGADAVFARSLPSSAVANRDLENGIAGSASVVSTPLIFLSGMADTNALPQATHKTLEKLVAALGQMKTPKENIVQLKAFLQPMADVDKVESEIVKFFDGKAPPVVYVEWNSPPPNPPIEIELVASAAGDFSHESDPVTFLTPPGTTATKVFSRVARVNHGKLIFMNEFIGESGKSAEDQVREIFSRLETTAKLSGTDLMHLVKATYYVSDDAASGKLNDLRPLYFDPKRPPAASKAKVRAIGAAGRTTSVDMIAVRAE